MGLDRDFPEIRELLRRVCVDFPGRYCQELKAEQAYPSEFVTALTPVNVLRISLAQNKAITQDFAKWIAENEGSFFASDTILDTRPGSSR